MRTAPTAMSSMLLLTKRLLLLLLTIVLALFAPTTDASYSLAVPNGETECFSIRVPKEYQQSQISGSYDCLDDEVDGSQFKVLVRNEKSNKIIWTSRKDYSEGNFRLNVAAGNRYSLCFENNISNEDDEYELDYVDVGFALRWHEPPRSLPAEEEGPEAKRALTLMDKATSIDEDWQNMLDHYDFLRTREANHRELIEAIFTRLWKWTLIEAVLVIFMAFLQVVYLRKFFEQRRYL